MIMLSAGVLRHTFAKVVKTKHGGLTDLILARLQ